MSKIIDFFTGNSAPDWSALCDRSATDAPLSDAAKKLVDNRKPKTVADLGDVIDGYQSLPFADLRPPESEPAIDEGSRPTARSHDGRTIDPAQPDTIQSLF